jgi:hypothetical protein
MTAQIRRVPLWIRVAGLVMAAGLAMGLALPGSAAASSSSARPPACAGTPSQGAGGHVFPLKVKEGQHSARVMPGTRPTCASGPGSPGLARAREGLACSGIPGRGAGDRALPVKVKEGQHSARVMPGTRPTCASGPGSPGLARVK